MLDVGPLTVVVQVTGSTWIGAPNGSLFFTTADCSGQAYIGIDGSSPLFDYAVVAGAIGNETIYAAARTASPTFVSPASFRTHGTDNCLAGAPGSTQVVLVSQSQSVPALGPAPYRVVRTP